MICLARKTPKDGKEESMAADGMKVDKIAHYLNVSAQMVQKWIDESMSVAH